MFEDVEVWLDQETGRWLAYDKTWELATSAKTKEQAEEDLRKIRDTHLKECVAIQ